MGREKVMGQLLYVARERRLDESTHGAGAEKHE